MINQNQNYNQEIDLAEYAAVLVKRWKLVLAVFLTSVTAAAVINYRAPKVWNISMIIEPSMLPDAFSGSLPAAKLLDTPGNIKARIDAGSFDVNVVNALRLTPYYDVRLEVSLPKLSTFLILSIKKPENEKELGVRILDRFFNELTAFYRETVDLKKDAVGLQISITANSVKSKYDSIKRLGENLKIIEAREIELLGELKETRTNTEQLLAKKNLLLESKAQGDDISSLLYLNTIQQNMAYFNQLNNQLADNKTKKETVVGSVKELQTDISNLGIEIEKLTAAKAGIRNLVMIQKPEISTRPVGPRKARNILLAAVLGLFGGAILAFFIDFAGKCGKP
ncbi:MAG: Wzz/FepE/Etk N-terminal domain-containing protein [Elusimicrobiota bacterium]